MLAARTSRARAYVEALVRAQLRPECLILFGDERCPPLEEAPAAYWPRHIKPLSLQTSIEDWAAHAQWSIEQIDADNVADLVVLEVLRRHAGKLVIYAGAGGQLVPAPLLAISPFLHIHSGFLPDYRGSTTLYYSLLEESRCACTALLLDSSIDTGAIVSRRHYPAPSAQLNVDHCYDGAIRADLLLRVMRSYLRHGVLPQAKSQVAQGRTYYVIHPLLKHLALLSLSPASQSKAIL